MFLGDELELLKGGGGGGGVGIFLGVISLKNTPTSHAVNLALFMHACSDFAMPSFVMHLLMQ